MLNFRGSLRFLSEDLWWKGWPYFCLYHRKGDVQTVMFRQCSAWKNQALLGATNDTVRKKVTNESTEDTDFYWRRFWKYWADKHVSCYFYYSFSTVTWFSERYNILHL